MRLVGAHTGLLVRLRRQCPSIYESPIAYPDAISCPGRCYFAGSPVCICWKTFREALRKNGPHAADRSFGGTFRGITLIDSTLDEGYWLSFALSTQHAPANRFTDGPFATEKATNRLPGLYANTSSLPLVCSRIDGDGRKIGHFDSFDSGSVPRMARELAALDAVV